MVNGPWHDQVSYFLQLLYQGREASRVGLLIKTIPLDTIHCDKKVSTGEKGKGRWELPQQIRWEYGWKMKEELGVSDRRCRKWDYPGEKGSNIFLGKRSLNLFRIDTNKRSHCSELCWLIREGKDFVRVNRKDRVQRSLGSQFPGWSVSVNL